eukprot:19681-Rhodomonas_salina.1
MARFWYSSTVPRHESRCGVQRSRHRVMWSRHRVMWSRHRVRRSRHRVRWTRDRKSINTVNRSRDRSRADHVRLHAAIKCTKPHAWYRFRAITYRDVPK